MAILSAANDVKIFINDISALYAPVRISAFVFR